MRKSLVSRYVRIIFILLAISVSLMSSIAEARSRARIEPKILDIPGYQTLICDFHMHTVFSDGRVWPTIRVGEAWRDGLDVFSITDHIEYKPFKENVVSDHNRSYEIAAPVAASMGLLMIKGSEITKAVPPGHFNAIFLQDSNPLDHENYLDCIEEAIKQKAFVFWNHPPFKQKDNQSIWHPEHTVVYEKGWLHGIEVVNGKDYYPEAHRWCLEKKLTMLSSSDVHNPIDMDYDYEAGERRPMTLVFATEKTEDAVKEALFARRTAVYAQDRLYGEKEYLLPIFKASVEIINQSLTIEGKEGKYVQVRNKSDIPFELEADGETELLTFSKQVTLVPDAVTALRISGRKSDGEGEQQVLLPFKVKNLCPAPDEPLKVSLPLKITFVAEKK